VYSVDLWRKWKLTDHSTSEELLGGFVRDSYDLHIHCGPESLPRQFNFVGIAEELRKYEMRGGALKSHFQYTTSWCIQVMEDERFKHLRMISSVTLNWYVGGIRIDPILAAIGTRATWENQAASQGKEVHHLPIIVWFPTIHSSSNLSANEREIPLSAQGRNKSHEVYSRLSRDIRPVTVVDNESLDAVLDTIYRNNLILATGHLSQQESLFLVTKASKKGIKKMIITHPVYDISLEYQKKLVNMGAVIEHTFAAYSVDGMSMNVIADQISAVGHQNCILTSDLGQLRQPSPPEGLMKFTDLLLKKGLTNEHVKVMLKENPRKLIEDPLEG
jgi:hypothetical protein